MNLELILSILGVIAGACIVFAGTKDWTKFEEKKEKAGPVMFDPMNIVRTIVEVEFKDWQNLQKALEEDYPEDLILNILHVERTPEKIKAVVLMARYELKKLNKGE